MSVYVQNNGSLMGEGSVVSVVDTEDIHGGTIREINAVSLYGDTVTAQTLLLGIRAHNAYGEPIVGTYDPGSSSAVLQSKSVTPTTSTQVVTYDVGYDGLSDVTVAAMPEGSVNTPTATKGSVSNHSVSVTPNVSYNTGYITNGSKTGTPVTVSASELVSGSETKTSNGTYDVTNLAELVVNVSGGGTPNLQTKSVTPSETAQTVTADTGYDGLSEVDVEAISSTYVGTGVARRSSSDLTTSGATVTAPAGYYSSAATKTVSSGSATGPSTLSGTAASVSTGNNTLTLTKTGVATTPTVSAGYVSSATASTATVTLTANVTTKAAATYHPSTTDQTIAASQYLTGAQTIKAVTTSNLVASNILSGVTVKVGDSTDDDCVASVTGTVEFRDIYVRSAAPTASVGNDGDIYIQE